MATTRFNPIFLSDYELMTLLVDSGVILSDMDYDVEQDECIFEVNGDIVPDTDGEVGFIINGTNKTVSVYER